MSRSNKNNRKKIRLSRNGTNDQPLRCSSSSGSSNYSDDMDVIRNAVLESLMKNAGAATAAAAAAGSGAATTPTQPPPPHKSALTKIAATAAEDSSLYDEHQHRYNRQQQQQQGKSDDESRADVSSSCCPSYITNTNTTTTTTPTVDSSQRNRKLETPPVAVISSSSSSLTKATCSSSPSVCSTTATHTIEELAVAGETSNTSSTTTMTTTTTTTTTTIPALETQDNRAQIQGQGQDQDQIRTDVKIVRIKTLDTEESKLLLIVDVLDRNPFRIEVNNQNAATTAAAKKRRGVDDDDDDNNNDDDDDDVAEDGEREAQSQQPPQSSAPPAPPPSSLPPAPPSSEQQQPQPHHHRGANKCIKVDIEALKRGECPKEIRNLCTKIRSRRIYKLPDELMRKFDQKGLKVFEWHSFNRPDEVIKLLLDDGGGGGGAGAAGAGTGSSDAVDATAATADVLRKRMIIGFRRRSTAATTTTATTTSSSSASTTTASTSTSNGGSSMTVDEPAAKIRRTMATAGGQVKLVRNALRRSRLATDPRSSRTRILQKLLKEYSISSATAAGVGAGNCANTATVWDSASQNKINRLVRSHLDLRAKEATERANNRRGKELNNDVTASTIMAVVPRSSAAGWKSAAATGLSAAQFSMSSALKRDNLDAAKISLNDDNVDSVSNSNADVTAIDGNSDALNNSNNDDNDSKAKKKNRCALCRKKVGLTGFECRCGGLYCGIHRYSDKHNCTFDYRQLGAQEIRRNNPVVIGEKIQKI